MYGKLQVSQQYSKYTDYGKPQHGMECLNNVLSGKNKAVASCLAFLPTNRNHSHRSI